MVESLQYKQFEIQFLEYFKTQKLPWSFESSDVLRAYILRTFTPQERYCYKQTM